MRSFTELLVIIAIGLGLGGALAWFSIQKNHGFGSIQIGQWTAWPYAGSKDADPYTRAKVAAGGEVPLGAAEGVAFHALTDDQNQQLQRNCQYKIIGQTPPARLWTISGHDLNGKPIFNKPDHAPATMLSRNFLRKTNGDIEIQAGPSLVSGNWLEVTGSGAYQLIIRLYDSPITSANKIVDPEMPSITRMDCIS